MVTKRRPFSALFFLIAIPVLIIILFSNLAPLLEFPTDHDKRKYLDAHYEL